MGKIPRYVTVAGSNFPPICDPADIRAAFTFVPEKDDVVILTYPKSGTTFTQQVVYLILNNGVPLTTSQEYFGSLPLLELVPLKKVEQMPRPRIIKTHLKFDRMAYSKDAKYIYVARNPADNVLSFYHHTRFFPVYFFDGDLDDYFNLYIEGKVDWGDYFDHVLGGYERRNEPNFLFVTYESLRLDSRQTILKIARFLGEEHYNKVLDNGGELLEKILKYSSLEFMKTTVNVFWKEEFTRMPSEVFQKELPSMENNAKLLVEAWSKGYKSVGDFVRKGAVGQGKAELSEEQKERLEKRIQEKFSHTDIIKLWKDI